MARTLGLLAILVVSVPLTAAADFRPLTGGGGGGSLGDTSLTYRDGEVYDDDLVPDRGLNQPFNGGDADAVALPMEEESDDAVPKETSRSRDGEDQPAR
ncbi:MAG: hypothetical protein AAGB11_06400 [Pseudomonadota bacterium]